jgi:hypothetical protein
VPWRLARNAGAAVAATVPALLLAGGGALVAYLVDRVDTVTTADDAVAAIAGGAAALLAAHRVATDRQGFAAGDALDAWVARCRDGLRYGAWAAGLLALAGSLVLRPDLWPLPGP